MSEGDAAYFAQFAAWLGLGNRFSAEQAGSNGVRVVLGPVSAGDAAMAQLLAAYLGLAAIAEDV